MGDDQERLSAWLHGTLDEAQHAAFEARLRRDPALRARVAAERRALQQVQQALHASIDATPPPPTLTYDQIAERVRRPRRAAPRGARYALPGVLALLVLFVAAALLLTPPDSARPIVPTHTPTPTVTPSGVPSATPTPTAEPSSTPGRLTIPTRTPTAPAATPPPQGVLISPTKGNSGCLLCSARDF